MRKTLLWLICFIFLGLLFACAQAVAPTPQVTVAPQKAVPVPQTASAAPDLSPTDTTWAKVVAAAKKEGIITIYGGPEFAGDGGRRTLEAFSKEYGIRVEALILSGRQASEKVQIENKMKQPIADIYGTGLSSATELSLLGLLDSIWQDLPELRNKADFKVDPLYTPNGDVLNMAFELTGVLINTKLVNAKDEPRSFLDLLDPKWKGKIILQDPRGGAGAGFAWFAEMRYYKLLDDDYFRRFARQEPNLWGGASIEAYNMVGRGEAWLSPYTPMGTVAPFILEGAPLKLLSMSEGTSLITQPIAMVKGSTHPNAVKLFLNWLLSKKGQEVYVKAFSTYPVRKDAPDFVDPRVKPQPDLQKYLARTYEIAEASNRYHKEGIAESIFGKR